ncbi:DUF1883 domain-containing protein [Clostridioides difficile]|nr:DUF1883 domain-containing protein [Clostridioides difficile]
MEYSYSKINLKKGDIVEVNLEKQANVILLDHINYVKFKNQKNYDYYGGFAKKNPCRMRVPNTGVWYLVVNQDGNSGIVNFSINTIQN